MQITRRMLFDGELLQLGHVVARPPTSGRQDLERQDCNVLVLPLAGAFAKHDSPRQHVVGTPNHAVFIEAAKPYRISYPGGIGDKCLTIRFPAGMLPPVVESQTLLPPAVMLARSLLWRELAANAWDPLEVEELAFSVLATVIGAARARDRRGSPRHQQQAERVKEAISLHPERKWTLRELARLACASPWHLAHIFRRETGASVYGYVLRSRLANALCAVLDSNAELGRIAHDAGFASHSHFTARFRALFGVTPTALRRTRRWPAAQLRKIVTAQAAATV